MFLSPDVASSVLRIRRSSTSLSEVPEEQQCFPATAEPAGNQMRRKILRLRFSRTARKSRRAR